MVWSSLWPEHPDLRTEFRLEELLGWNGASVGCRLTWTLCVQESLGSSAEVRRLARRTAELVEGRLRDVFDSVPQNVGRPLACQPEKPCGSGAPTGGCDSCTGPEPTQVPSENDQVCWVAS